MNQKIEFMDYQLNDLKERYAHQKEVSDKMFSAINSNISHHENAKENYNDKCEVYKTQIQQFQNEIGIYSIVCYVYRLNEFIIQ